MFKEFKKFIARGNVMNLAVGVVIGGAFTAIVNALVTDLLNPLIGLFIGGVDFSSWVVKVGGAHFKFGSFVNAIINFIIISFVVFLIVKAVNKAMPDKPKETEPDNSELYLKEIRDALVEKNK